MKDMMAEIQSEVSMELGNSTAVSNDDSNNNSKAKNSPIEPNAYCPADNDEEKLVNLETKLLHHQEVGSIMLQLDLSLMNAVVHIYWSTHKM